jgi:hypothetical protein
MVEAVYCVTSDEPKANAILTQLRSSGLSSEISVLLEGDADTRNISVKEDAFRGAKIGSIVGALIGLTLPGVGAVLAAGPLVALLSALSGAAAGGAVGGLAGGSGTFAPLGLPKEVEERLHERFSEGDILIAVHSNDPAQLHQAVRIFRSEGAEFIYDREQSRSPK